MVRPPYVVMILLTDDKQHYILFLGSTIYSTMEKRMRYLDLYNTFKALPVFTLNEIRNYDHNFYRPRLNEWQNKGYIKKITRGFYLFPENIRGEETLFEIANRIYGPSYISCETALAYHSLIPEGAYQMTSVTTLKPYLFQTQIGSFRYRSIVPKLFFGYEPIRKNGSIYKIATPEKAILDILYYHPELKLKGTIEEMRFSSLKLKKLLANEKFRQYSSRFDDNTFTDRIKALKEGLSHA